MVGKYVGFWFNRFVHIRLISYDLGSVQHDEAGRQMIRGLRIISFVIVIVTVACAALAGTVVKSAGEDFAMVVTTTESGEKTTQPAVSGG